MSFLNYFPTANHQCKSWILQGTLSWAIFHHIFSLEDESWRSTTLYCRVDYQILLLKNMSSDCEKASGVVSAGNTNRSLGWLLRSPQSSLGRILQESFRLETRTICQDDCSKISELDGSFCARPRSDPRNRGLNIRSWELTGTSFFEKGTLIFLLLIVLVMIWGVQIDVLTCSGSADPCPTNALCASLTTTQSKILEPLFW